MPRLPGFDTRRGDCIKSRGTIVATKVDAAIAALKEAHAEALSEVADAAARATRIAKAIAELEGEATDALAAPPTPPPNATRPIKPKAASKKGATSRRGGRVPTVDYPAIADWINKAKATGNYSVAGLAGRFGVSEAAAKNYIGRCRQQGLLEADKSWTGEPITKTPVDHQAARDAAADVAAPKQGVGGASAPWQPATHASPAPATQPTLKITPEQAAALIDDVA